MSLRPIYTAAAYPTEAWAIFSYIFPAAASYPQEKKFVNTNIKCEAI